MNEFKQKHTYIYTPLLKEGGPLYTSIDPALPGSIMRREGSNISRCKPCFNNCTPKKGLHLEIFDPSSPLIIFQNMSIKITNLPVKVVY